MSDTADKKQVSPVDADVENPEQALTEKLKKREAEVRATRLVSAVLFAGAALDLLFLLLLLTDLFPLFFCGWKKSSVSSFGRKIPAVRKAG